MRPRPAIIFNREYLASLAAAIFLAAPPVFCADFGGAFEYLAGPVSRRDTPANPSNVLALTDYTALSELKLSLSSDDKKTMLVEARGRNEQASGVSAFYLDQAYIVVAGRGALSAKIGRQRLGFGAGYLWNPVNNLDVKKDVYNPSKYSEGIDALSLRLDLRGPLQVPSSLSFQAIPPSSAPRDASYTAVASQFYALVGVFEFGATASGRKISADDSATLVGAYATADVLGSIFGAEVSYSRDQSAPAVSRAGISYSGGYKPQFLLNFNRRTSEKGLIVVEYYHNGRGADAGEFEAAADVFRSSYTIASRALAAFLSPGHAGRNYVFATYSTEISGDISFSAGALSGIDNPGGFVYPQISWTGAKDLTVSVECISNFHGGLTNEFSLSPYSAAAFVRAIYYF